MGYVNRIAILVLSSHLRLGLPSGLFPSGLALSKHLFIFTGSGS
jgi:hypothetical protein